MDYRTKKLLNFHLTAAKCFGKSSEEEAIPHYIKAAELGHYTSQRYLVSYYSKKKNKTEQEVRETIRWSQIVLEHTKMDQQVLEGIIERNLKILKLREECAKDVDELITQGMEKIHPNPTAEGE